MKKEEQEKNVLVLFSGGKDSFLSTCRLINEGYNVFLITYENGSGLKSENVCHGVDRLIKKYGEEKVKFLGIKNTSGIWRDFLVPYFNLKPSEIKSMYGEIPISQFNCTTCRLAMYIYSIVICKKMNIKLIAEGARRDQGFIIEQDKMLQKFKELLQKYGLTLLLPMQEMNSDWDLKNEILINGFVPKTLEPQCLLGIPLNQHVLDNDILEGVLKFYDDYLSTRAQELIELLSKVKIEDNKDLI